MSHDDRTGPWMAMQSRAASRAMASTLPWPALACAVLLVGLLTACSSDGMEADRTPIWSDAEVRRELRVGVADGADELMFGRVSAIAVSPTGRIYVADSEPTVIRSYTPDGAYLDTVGREGQGPGEYARIAGLAALPNGGVAVWDWGNRRLTAFAEDGSLAWSAPAQSSFMLDALTVDESGSLYLLASEGDVSDLSRTYLLRRFTAAGEEAGVIELHTSEPPIAGYGILDMIRMRISNFQTGTLQAWSPRGYLVSTPNDDYRVTVHRPGEPVELTREIEPAPIEGPERAEIERFLAWVEGRMTALGREATTSPIPASKPLFRALEIALDGRIWLRRYVRAEFDESIPAAASGEAPERRWLEPAVYDVWEPEGTFLGTVRLPEGLVARQMRGDLIWGTEVDADGVERIVRYRVVPTPSAEPGRVAREP